MVEQKVTDRRAEHPKGQRARPADERTSKTIGANSSETNKSGQRFVSKEASVENKLKMSTIGLVNLEDFQRIKGELEEERRREAANTLVRRRSSSEKVSDRGSAEKLGAGGSDLGSVEGGKSRQKKGKRESKKKKSALSFGDDDDDDDNGSDGGNNDVVPIKRARKNPAVDTSFLPDKEREEEEARLREELRQKWLRDQEAIKEEAITITYSFWDGSGHRKQVRCKKGDTIAQFLDKCKAQVPELRGSKGDSLVYVKEDLIIPHHYTFYDFIINKTRGKSGPLFSFDVHDDVRLTHDVRIEKDDSHAGKVCERSWYERNKHIFPANRWEIFSPEKDYGSYTIKDSKKKKT
ncbi:hypothetical protein IW140_002045 [Coemansia sp. RSA 1813]|nr:hypothetical protein LPJ74_000461 [Coemansia sp. RSA 1843]KAJ2090554.1 hypothetical protein IW138_002561 [Coemansia sp. RSA 986]KAJ2216358.1 hypothetical protein EV179_001384 [Coemansia sp. RSA 487]KAJ2570857.1 hypothetical protein IW140_002045 [Coemansia sp. RSA 1813]